MNQRNSINVVLTLFCQRWNNVDKHTSAQLSFSTKFQRWNNVGTSTMNRPNSINFNSTLFCQRWNNVDKFTSAQLSFSTKYQGWCVCWLYSFIRKEYLLIASKWSNRRLKICYCFSKVMLALYTVVLAWMAAMVKVLPKSLCAVLATCQSFLLFTKVKIPFLYNIFKFINTNQIRSSLYYYQFTNNFCYLIHPLGPSSEAAKGGVL